MLTVIIPTLFKCPRIIETLVELSESKIVGEIILIDNTGIKKNLDIPKLNYILEETNTYVNPSWNKGVRISSNDNICILNDDIWFDWKFLKDIEDFMNSNNCIIGMSEENYNSPSSEFKISKIEPDWKTSKGYRPMAWGCCFFLNKKNWIEIPSNILIWGGDDYLFYQNNQVPNYKIEGIKCYGSVSLTADDPSYESTFSPIKKQDMINMKDYIKSGSVQNYLLGTIWQ